MRLNGIRLAVHQLQRQTPQTMTVLRPASFPYSASMQMQLRSMGVFSSIKKTVSDKLEHRNQQKQGAAVNRPTVAMRIIMFVYCDQLW